MVEPANKRAVAFVDGQNLFHAAREGFGYAYPNYDVTALAKAVCASKGWNLAEVRFYTGIPTIADKPFWNHFWQAKFAQMGRDGVTCFQRALRYRDQTIDLGGGATITRRVGSEKGIDVRIALDVVSLARMWKYDVAVIFSQDQDLSEAAEEVRSITQIQSRWIKVASAFPVGPTSRNKRGINKTDWVTIDQATYDAAIDPRDYRPKK